MNWNNLDSAEKLNSLHNESKENKIIIFKHSTRCSISSMALSRFERNFKEEELKDAKAYFLDLITFRNLSNQIADTYNVRHESPQVLVISNGECIYNASHSGISYNEIIDQL